MCGLAGEIRFDGRAVDPGVIARMNDRQSARGPDGQGLLVFDRLGVGHRRLKIMDLSDAAQQPMVDPMLGLGVVFNGAIYNHHELREDLVARGYKFHSSGDTEVLIKAYHAWGPGFVRRLQGMFAFAIWERDSGKVLLGRDRLGIKPLYLAPVPGGLRFASTLPALLASGDLDDGIDAIGLHHYLSLHAIVPPPHTLLRGVRKLSPGTLLHVEPDGQQREERYWSLSFDRDDTDEQRSFEDWQELLLDGLRTAVKRRLVADVPVGALLSGGVDSSLIVGLMAEQGVRDLRTYNVGFEDVGGEVGNEFQYADLVARHFGTAHERLFVPEAELLERLPAAIEAMSEPMVSHDCIGFYLLSEAVARHSKVVQSGQGADEVFGGYHWYPPLLESADPVADYARVFMDRDHATLLEQLDPRWHTPTDPSRGFVDAHFHAPGAETGVDKALRLDTTVMLVDDPVKRVDNMTMAWGLEARVPFLDHELVELAARIPPALKLKDGGKGVLKDVARQVVPHEVIDRPKGYFPVPQLKYISGPYLELVKEALGSVPARQRSLFRRDYLEQLFAAPEKHITPLRGSALWQVALLELWLQNHGI